MKNTVLKTQNKYQEYLQQIEIECVKRDNLFKNEVEKYDYTDTISVYQINLSSKEDQLKFCSVLFMPTYIYQNNSYKINIKEQQIDLLNCMYKYALYDNQGVKYAQICLQNISGNQQTLISYELGCSFFDQEESDVNLKTGILGAKYILLVIKSIFKKELHLLNLDLTLIIKQNLKENFYMFEQEYNFTSDMPQEDANIFESCIDYFEDGIIYYECQQVLFRIVICQKFVSSRVFEERINILLRLLPVTQSEYNYYFKNSDQSSLSGYCNNEKDTLILFAVFSKKIYKLNMFNLAIISQTKNKYYLDQNISKNNLLVKTIVLPIQLKNRQQKIFSSWTLLLKADGYDINLFDWREKDLFNKQNLIKNQEDLLNFKDLQRNYLIDKILVKKEQTLIQLRYNNRYTVSDKIL